MVGFKADGSLWAETCSSVMCDVIIRISKENVCAFC
jgi:hypothetical protein